MTDDCREPQCGRRAYRTALTPSRWPAPQLLAPRSRAGAPRGRQRLHGADRRRVRHRQGSAGALHPPPLAARRRAIRRGQLRGDSRNTCSRRCCSVRSAAPSPARTRRTLASSSRPRAARCCWMRSRRCRSACRPSCCASCRSARSSASAAATPLALDVRVLATTNRRLREEVAAGRFREDLYYRLNVFPLAIAPLRARREDVLPLAMQLLSAHCRPGARIPALSAEAAHLLLTYRLAWQRARAGQRPAARAHPAATGR